VTDFHEEHFARISYFLPRAFDELTRLNLPSDASYASSVVSIPNDLRASQRATELIQELPAELPKRNQPRRQAAAESRGCFAELRQMRSSRGISIKPKAID